MMKLQRQRNQKLWWLNVYVGFAVAACGGETGYHASDSGSTASASDPGEPSDEEAHTNTGDPLGKDCAVERDWTMDFLDEYCGACHGAESSGQGSFDYIGDLDRMLVREQIVAGEPSSSPVVTRTALGTMPPASIEPRPEELQIERLQKFVEECIAVSPDQCQSHDPLPLVDQLREIQDDITSVELDDRRFTRYLSVAHLYAAGYCDADLDMYRVAISKLINSLSSEPKVVRPWPVDSAHTIYRIDLRDYGWDQPSGTFPDRWEALVAASPYSVERLEDEAETIKTFALTKVPVVLGDAFIDVAAQPPLYHRLARIPKTLTQLEQQLGLNVQENIEAEEIARAGVLNSGVSQQNRVVERHEIPLGADRVFWISYDFSDDSKIEQNIFASPLDFQEQGGEVIFSLPNGLHAYMLIDELGNRIDDAPENIVVDNSQDDRKVRNGISCFGCHPSLLSADDAVRDYVASSAGFDAQTKDIVDAIYPSAPTFQAYVDNDSEHLRAAIESTGVDTNLPLEPISEIFTRFQLNVDIKIAAAELGISEGMLRTQLGGLEPALSPLADARIKRDTWTSLYANTICRLQLGDADDPQCRAQSRLR